MKKRIKYSLAAIMVLAASFLLCSCKALDEMKLDHAVYTEKTVINTIEFRGKTYDLYEDETGTAKWEEPLYMISNGVADGVVTEPDVPVLLSRPYGEPIRFRAKADEAPLFLSVERYSPGTDQAPSDRFYYERSAKKEFETLLKQAKMDHFYLEKSNYNLEEDTYDTMNVLLNDNAVKVIRKTLERPFDPATDFDAPDKIEDLSAHYLEPIFCDKSKTFSTLQRIQIAKAKGKDASVYIACREDSGNAFDSNGALLNASWKQVAEKDADVIRDLFREYENELHQFYYEEEEF